MADGDKPKRMTGTVNSKGKNGFGFITGEDRENYFFHATALPQDQFEELRTGWRVSFKPLGTAKGPRALEVRIEEEEMRK